MLEVANLVSGYNRDVNILQGVSVTAMPCKITIIIGANGTGKSTLLKNIYGFLWPNEGSILYKGENIGGMKPFKISRKGISYVMQRISVFPYLTVEENLELGAWAFRRDKRLVDKRMDENYGRFEVLGRKKKAYASALSGGEQRMLQIGRALMIDPDLLLLDEPTAGLAPRIARQLYGSLQGLRDEERRSMLLVDQNVRHAMEIADYIYVLEMGKNKAEGTRGDFDTDLKEMIKTWL
jgi:branched-chain amino acid transport system ATP-binding protein